MTRYRYGDMQSQGWNGREQPVTCGLCRRRRVIWVKGEPEPAEPSRDTVCMADAIPGALRCPRCDTNELAGVGA